MAIEQMLKCIAAQRFYKSENRSYPQSYTRKQISTQENIFLFQGVSQRFSMVLGGCIAHMT
jgi:hypothetical protein